MAIHRFVFHNGRVRNATDAMLSPGQLGLLAGWGVFSTLRIEDGVLFEWDRHWARMSHDAQAMHVPMPSDPESVRRGLIDLIVENQAENATLRLVVVRNGGGTWEGPPTTPASDVIALTANRTSWGASTKLTYQPNARHSRMEFAGAKILSWAQNLCWYERAHEKGFDECILLNELGHVTECTSANVFAVSGHEVWTPPLSSGLLPGVTRDIVLRELSVPGITVSERILAPEDLESADSVFITSTTRDLMPVAQLGEKHLTTSGEVRLELQNAFRNYLGDYVTAHRPIYRTVDALRQ